MRRIFLSVAAGAAIAATVLAVVLALGGVDLDGGGDGGGGESASGAIERSDLEQIAPREFQDWQVVRDDTGFRGLELSWPGDLFAPERDELTANGYVTDYFVRFRAADRSGELFANVTLFRDEEGARRSETIGLDNVVEQLGRPARDEPALAPDAKKVSTTDAAARLYGYFWRVENVVLSVTALGRNLGEDAVLGAAQAMDERAQERAER